MTSGGLSDYFPFLFPDGNGLVAVFTGYFDESVRTDGSQPICLAGLIFTPGHYKLFRKYWQRNVLRYRGRKFDAFHMTDLVAGRQEYEGLKIADRLVILDHAIHAIEKNATCGVAVYFAQAEFEQKAPSHWADLFGSIYVTAVSMCLQATGHWLTKWGSQMEVLYVLERGHKFRAQADEFLTAFSNDPEMRRRCRYRNHIFEFKAEPGLQAADLSAWTVTRALVFDKTKETPKGIRPFVKPMLKFAHCLGDRYKLYAYEGKKLEQFFAAMSKPSVLFRRVGSHPPGLR